jgi:hypothetical protein
VVMIREKARREKLKQNWPSEKWAQLISISGIQCILILVIDHQLLAMAAFLAWFLSFLLGLQTLWTCFSWAVESYFNGKWSYGPFLLSEENRFSEQIPLLFFFFFLFLFHDRQFCNENRKLQGQLICAWQEINKKLERILEII